MKESHRIEWVDLSNSIVKPKKVEMKVWEIWTGCRGAIGQGDSPITEPIFWGTQEASTFETACIKHELIQMLNSIEKQDKEGYVDSQSKEWFYNARTNSNTWVGKYYSSEKEALKHCR